MNKIAVVNLEVREGLWNEPQMAAILLFFMGI
jgi:hypothetical protein